MTNEIDLMQSKVAPIAAALKLGLENAQGLQIRNDEHLEQVQEQLKQLKSYTKQLEEGLSEFTDPAKAIIKAAKARFDPYLDMAKQIDSIVRDKCVSFRYEATRKKAELQEKAQAAITAQAPVAEQRQAIAAVNAMAVPKTKAVSYVDVPIVTWRVTDASKVPAAYLQTVINTLALQDAIDKGARAIDGVEIKEEIRTHMRVGS